MLGCSPRRGAIRGSANGTLQQPKQLSELQTQGILTEDEFARQKAKILAS